MNKNEKLAKELQLLIENISEYFIHPQNNSQEAYSLCPYDKESFIWPGFRERENVAKKQQRIISENLTTLSLPIFEKVVLKWDKSNNPSKFLKKYPDDFPTIALTEFAPSLRETIEASYEKCLRVQRSRRYRNYSSILQEYKTLLSEKIFKNSECTKSEQAYIVAAWHRKLFESCENNKSSRKEAITGRWSSGDAIDISAAKQLVLYFANNFIHSLDLKDAETACFLLLLIRLSILEGECLFSLQEMINLKIADFSFTTHRIEVKTIETQIPENLKALLLILKQGRRDREVLFRSISIHSLKRSFKRVSRILFPQQANPILPETFLSFPHPHIGHRIPQPLLQKRRKGLILSIQHHYDCFLKHLKLATQHRHLPSSYKNNRIKLFIFKTLKI